VAADRDGRVGLGDDDGDVAALVLVVAVAGEGPVGRAAGHVGEAGAEVQRAGALAADARLRAAGPVGVAVVDAGVASDHHGRRRLGDDDGDVAALVLVVAVAGEGPVGRAAGHVGEAGAEVQRAGALAADARLRAAGPVGVAVVDAGVAADRDGRVGLGDDDG